MKIIKQTKLELNVEIEKKIIIKGSTKKNRNKKKLRIKLKIIKQNKLVKAWVLKKLSLSIRPFYKSSVGISSIILMVCVAECLKRSIWKFEFFFQEYFVMFFIVLMCLYQK